MKKTLFFALVFNLSLTLFSHTKNSTQVIQSGHWIYDALYSISLEQKNSSFLDNQPLTIGELKFYFYEIEYENLSNSGKKIYDKILNFFNHQQDFFPDDDLRLFLNVKTSPEFYFKTNPKIDWNFRYFVNDFMLTFPLIIGFSDYFTIEPDFFIGKNYSSIHQNENFTNIIYKGEHLDFLFPKFAYGSSGLTFEKWGVNLVIGKEGLSIGNTKIGSIIYNQTFETDCYVQLNLFSKRFKYSMDVAQVSPQKFLYIHQVNFRPFKNFKIGIVEGSLLNSSFELRYLNPFMIMHSFGSWGDYKNSVSPTEYKYYGEARFCAYLGFTFEYMPFKNSRIYGMYAQNEILDLGGNRSDSSLSVPDSLGGQLGFELNFPLDFGYLKTNLEAIYTSPFLYIKHSPEWSLYKTRSEMQTTGVVNSWIGSPLGPDNFALQLCIDFDSQTKWNCGFKYLFSIKGENDFSIFEKKSTVGEENQEIYSYYPSVEYDLAETDENRKIAKNKGRNMWMTGTKEYKNTLCLSGTYSFFENFKVFTQINYSFIFNNHHLNEEFAQGFEFCLGCEYQLF